MKTPTVFLLCLLIVSAAAACRPDRPPLPEPTPTPVPVKPLPSSFPTPTLFDTTWSDREPYREGLVSGERAVLDQLPGATVYHMNLNIAEDLVHISGTLEILYTNLESEALDSLYLHIFLNLLGGSLTVGSADINGEPASPIYQMENSVLQLPLDSALSPGESLVARIQYEGTIPTDVGRNHGIVALKDEILALAHFYPMIAVYDDLGWHVQLPAEHGDIVYADSSFYLVRVTAPKRLMVAASGIEVERSEDSNSQTITFAAGPMRDFYLAASSQYERRSVTVGETQINSYAPRDLGDGAAAALEYASSSLLRFNQRFGDYPFVELDIVATPNLALGIEYPGIFALTTRIYDLGQAENGVPNQVILESVTAHETAHQWFYSVVGNDQLNEPWVDESLTQYATWLYFLDQYGEASAQGLHQSFIERWNRVEQAEIPIDMPVENYSPLEYSAIVYGRGPLFFDALREKMGTESVDEFLRTYYQVNKWGIGSTKTMLELARGQCDCSLAAEISQWMTDS